MRHVSILERRTMLSLAFIVAVGLALRLAYLLYATSRPGFFWDDPDHYSLKALELARAAPGWRFSFDAVTHSVEGAHYALPPLYPTFLSVFAAFPGYPLTAQVGQIVLATCGIVLVFFLGRQIHSDRAGLLAAAAFALWLPSVIAVWSTMQEALYIPLLLLGFVTLFHAIERGSGFEGFLLAGAVFGLAALTRSMPVYFVPFVCALLVVGRRVKPAPTVSAFLLGFALLTVPYSVALSRHLGRPTFIENHAGLRVASHYGEKTRVGPPALVETASLLTRAFFLSPARVLGDWWQTGRSLLQANGGRLLQIYLGSETRREALLWKIAAHTLGDFLFLGSLVLAPIGLALCARSHLAALCLIWILLSFALTVLSGFGGPRLRASFEPHLIALAAVPLAGGYRRVKRSALACALGASLGLGALVAPQLPAGLRAQADYGVDWPLAAPPKRSPMTGQAGFNVLAVGNEIELALRPRNPGRRSRVAVRLEGERMEEVVLDESERWFRYPWPRTELVHVEIEAKDDRTGAPVKLLVVVPAR